jgi:hypothetical protein
VDRVVVRVVLVAVEKKEERERGREREGERGREREREKGVCVSERVCVSESRDGEQVNPRKATLGSAALAPLTPSLASRRTQP